MGSASSKQPVTPARPLRNKHLSHVSDPRSPTSGIPRTPIEVEQASTRVTPQVAEVVEVGQEAGGPCCSDPRSPTPGISRTPLRPTVTAALHSLVKKLNHAFTYEEGTQLGAEEEYRDLLHPQEEHCQSSMETEEAQQATDFFRETRKTVQSPELLMENAEPEQTTTCFQWSEDYLRMDATKASPEEVEIAMDLLRLSESRSVENEAIHASLEMQLGLVCMDRPLATLEGPATENAVLDRKDEHCLHFSSLGSTDGSMKERVFKVSREEELEVAVGLLRLIDVVKRDEITGLCTSPTAVAEHTKTVCQGECQAKEESGPLTHSCIEPRKNDFLQEKELQLESIEGVFNEATSEVPMSTEAVPRATHLPSSPTSKSTGVKALRQRPRKVKGKVLTVSASHGRSPLKILSDDNSPSTLTHRQVKKTLAMSEGPVEQVDSTSRPLKVVRSWEHVHNKENACYTGVEKKISAGNL